MNDDIKELLQQGTELMAAQHYDAALQVFERAAALDPKSYEAQINLGNAAVSQELLKEGIAAFRRAQALRPASTEALYCLGCAYFLDGQNVAALKAFNRCEKAGFASVEMYGLMELIFLDAKDYTQAIRCANRAIKLEPLNPGPYMDKAQIFLQQGKAREAVACLADIEELLPDAGEPYLLQARIYTQTEEYEEALKVLDRAAVRFPEDAAMAVERMRVLNAMGAYAQAVEAAAAVRPLLEGMPEEARDFAVQLGIAQAGVHDIDASVATLAELAGVGDGAANDVAGADASAAADEPAAADGPDAEALFLLANECFAAERYEEAERYGGQLMGLSDAEPRFRAAGVFWNAYAKVRLGRGDEALEACRLACRTLRQINIGNPGLMEVYMYRALCHKELGEFDKAVALTDHMIAFAPQSPAGYAFKADVLQAKGDVDEAATLRAKALELDPSFVV